MNHIQILKRAFQITIHYRVLWIFGFLLALTAGGGSGSGGGNSGGGGGNSSSSGSLPGLNGQNPFDQFGSNAPVIGSAIIAVVIALICFFVILAVISTIVRYVSETAVIRMVSQYEDSGEKLSFRQGWRLGWSKSAFKLFLIDFLIGICFFVALIISLGFAAVPFLALLAKDMLPLQIIGALIGSALVLTVIAVAIVAGIAINLLVLLARRICVLDETGLQTALKRAFDLLKRHPGDMVLMGLSVFGIEIAYALITIPLILLFLFIAIITGGLPALVAGAITSIFAEGAAPWIVAGVVGFPIFLLTLIIPASVLGGWQQIFSSSAWTLAYRETLSLEKVALKSPEPAQASSDPGETEAQ